MGRRQGVVLVRSVITENIMAQNGEREMEYRTLVVVLQFVACAKHQTE
jgi:hypothetical protein